MCDIKQLKLKQSEAILQYNKTLEEVQRLQEQLLMTRGSIETMQKFIDEEENREDDN